MDEQLKSNLTSSKLWVRVVYMLLLALFCYLASFFIAIVIVVQLIITLISGSYNKRLRAFSLSLIKYIQQSLMFLSFNSDNKPFPFSDWPEVDEPESVSGDTFDETPNVDTQSTLDSVSDEGSVDSTALAQPDSQTTLDSDTHENVIAAASQYEQTDSQTPPESDTQERAIAASQYSEPPEQPQPT